MALGSRFSLGATGRVLGIALLGVVVAFVGAVSALRFCQALPRSYVTPSGNANIDESISVEFAGTTVSKTAFASALENVLAKQANKGVGVQIRPDFLESNAAVALSDDSYVSALDDAARKAKLLAQHAGVALGPIIGVDEGYGGQPPSSFPNGVPLKGSPVTVVRPTAANGPLVLGVSYRLANGDAQRTISVLGYSSGSRRTSGSSRVTTRLTVAVSARGNNLAEALRNVAPYEGLVRRAAAQVGLPPAAVSKADVSLNVY
ncbi:MAG TPA: SIMPL domain-containing protein [Candidatus Baltobacteraceae bacterium]|nr:SIMPL domain-containing protein [Candidatus Baltobacteraceae bacterium]